MTKDRLWGIERYDESELCGQLVCPLINIWSSPSRMHLIAKVLHDEEVEISEPEIGPDGSRCYFIETKAGTIGWVSENFLKEAGSQVA